MSLFCKRKSTVKPIIQQFSVLFSCFSYEIFLRHLYKRNLN
ncbi:hypothetical protein HMPREF0373_01299 [Eubacterium ramulus ATCC 29099]|uniref:Lipoprotein n=1 Tax=Eubacterium ramulus ATCC 29099 TaxID=1256908 RepID=U2PUN8_EUBRA|nr:hypothetical protein HMPREF0373_01299 [Eubacterium ramulus ATCC 29099]